MTLYNSHDTLPVLYYDPWVSTLFWYLPQVTDLAISDPLVLIARFYGTTKVPGINYFVQNLVIGIEIVTNLD